MLARPAGEAVEYLKRSVGWSRSTTMTGGKKEIKERITLLMKKPKTALITAVALLLIATVLVGCTFSGSVDTSNDEKETEKTTEN